MTLQWILLYGIAYLGIGFLYNLNDIRRDAEKFPDEPLSAGVEVILTLLTIILWPVLLIWKLFAP